MSRFDQVEPTTNRTSPPDARAEPAYLDGPTIGGLGTTLAVFAHPDDETYLAGGGLAALRDRGQRGGGVAATRGGAGDGLHGGGTRGGRAGLGGVRTEGAG